MDSFYLNVIKLMQAAIDGVTPELTDNVDFESIFKTYPRLIPLLYYGAIKSHRFIAYAKKQELLRKISQELAKNSKQIYLQKELCKRFDEEGIEYCLLKGCEVRNLYPFPTMRPMKDCDILVKEVQYNRIKTIMVEEGYSFVNSSLHDYVWKRENGYQIELHYVLIEVNSKYKYVNTFIDKTHNHFLIPEYSFIYLIVHFAKHIDSFSAPIKGLLDIYLYRKQHNTMNWELINLEIDKLGLTAFYKTVCETIDCWFSESSFNEKTEILSNMILAPYSQKTEKSHNASFMALYDSYGKIRFRELIKNLIKPYGILKYEFPILKKHPILLPFIWFFRIARTFIRNISNKTDSIHNFLNPNQESISKLKNDLKKIGMTT